MRFEDMNMQERIKLIDKRFFSAQAQLNRARQRKREELLKEFWEMLHKYDNC